FYAGKEMLMQINKPNSWIIRLLFVIVAAIAILVKYPILQVGARPGPRIVSDQVVSPLAGSGALAVNPVLDSARQVSAAMSEEGGTLSATAINGTVFTLTIPQDALAAEEEITMTPIVSIPDLPFSGGLASGGAVQLGPEGLLLTQPATLEIKSSAALSVQEQTPFSWYKSGDDFHLFPLSIDVAAIKMQIT